MAGTHAATKNAEAFEKYDDYINVVTTQGQLLTWKRIRQKSIVKGGGKRGCVQGFSLKSRFNMLKKVNTILWTDAKPMVFITLTYPPECYPPDRDTIGVQRAVFWRYVEGYMKKRVPCLWRIEWKGRWMEWEMWITYPHVHILAFGAEFIPFELINYWWQRCLGYKKYTRTEIERVENEKKAGFYVAKYCGKPPSSLVISTYHNSEHPGRQWGMLRQPDLPVHDKKVFVFKSEGEVNEYHAKFSRKSNKGIDFGSESFTLLGYAASELSFLLQENCLDSGYEVG